jgi:hypothetical protein
MISRSLAWRDTCAFMYKAMNPKVQWPDEHLGIMEAQITHSPINDMLNIKLLCSRGNIHIKLCINNSDH